MAKSTVEYLSKAVLDLTEEEPIRVLHVDDEAGFLKTAKPCLEMQGAFQVETASSVEEASEKLKKKKFDVVVSDYVMPEKDGLQFLKELRDSGNSIPFILFTGKGREEVAIKALNLGADYYMNKIGESDTVYYELSHSIRQAAARSKAEEELARSETKYRSLVENTGAGVITVDLKGVFTFVNKAICGMTGYSEKEFLDKPFINFIHPDDRNRMLQIFGNFMKKPELNPRFDFRVIHKKGHIVHLHSAPTLYKHEGQIAGSCAIITDITERKQANEILRFQRDLAVTLAKTDTIREAVNKVFDEFLEFEEFDCAGFYLVDRETGDLDMILHRGLPKGFVEKVSHFDGDSPYTKVVMEGKPLYQKTSDFPPIIREDLESDGILAAVAIPIQYKGEVVADLNLASHSHHEVSALTRDTLELVCAHIGEAIVRVRTEERLRKSEERYRVLVESASDAIFTLNEAGDFLSANQEAAKSMGVTPEGVIGKNMYDLFPKDVADRQLRSVKAVFETGKPLLASETSTQTKSGQRWYSTSLVPINDSQGKVIHVTAIARDITERKRMHEELKTTLEKLVVLNEKLGVVGRLTRHDVRNKLSAVINDIYLAKQKLTDDNKTLTHLKNIESAVQQIERIFDFARTYEKLGVEQVAHMDVEKTLEESVKWFPDLHGVEVVNTCHGLTVLADSLLRRIFYNLIDNSLKHGGKFSRIGVYCEEAGKDQLKLVYADDGVGIPEAEKEKIFEEGYGKDTGYGLYLIRKICEVYEWNIRETGKYGKGAQFSITIPKMNKSGKAAYQLH